MIAIDTHRDLIRGRVVPGTAGFTLLPEEPAWATRRALAVAEARAGDSRCVTTSVVAG